MVFGLRNPELLNGFRLIMDADFDSYISMETDDQLDVALSGTVRLQYTAGAFAFQEATIISSTGNITLNPTSLLLLAAGDTFQSSGAAEIGISVNNTALTVGSLGSLVIPVKTDTGAPNDAAMGDVVGAIAYNSSDNTFEIRDTTTDAPLSVGVAGYVIQSSVPVLEDGWYHADQLLGTERVDERKCVVCGGEMYSGDQVVMWANGHVRNDDLHAVFGHPHLERDGVFRDLVERVGKLEAA